MKAGFALAPVEALLVSVSPGEMRAAAIRQGQPWEITVLRDSRPTLVGSVHAGRVRRVERSLDAAFVDIGLDTEAFLPLGRNAGRISEGAFVRVQFTRDGVDGKQPAVSTRIALPGRYLVYSPTHPGLAASRRFEDPERRRRLQGLLLPRIQANEGVVLRRPAQFVDDAVILAELGRLRAKWQGIADMTETPPRTLHTDLPPLLRLLRDGDAPPRILIDDRQALATARTYAATEALDMVDALAGWSDPGSLLDEHGVEAEIEAAIAGSARLPSGGMLHVGTTRALTAIDVDSAKHAGRGAAADMLLQLDLEAAVEAARVIRCRNLSGLIVIDFASVPGKARRQAIDARLRGAFADDIAECRFVPMSELGLVEISRQRLGPSLPERLGVVCRVCKGDGFVTDPETEALAALRAVLRQKTAAPTEPADLVASPAAIDRLRTTLADARRETERRVGQALIPA